MTAKSIRSASRTRVPRSRWVAVDIIATIAFGILAVGAALVGLWLSMFYPMVTASCYKDCSTTAIGVAMMLM